MKVRSRVDIRVTYSKTYLYTCSEAALPIDLHLDDAAAANSKMMSAILNSHFYYINVNIARRLITRHMALFLQDGAARRGATRRRRRGRPNYAREIRMAPVFRSRDAWGLRASRFMKIRSVRGVSRTRVAQIPNNFLARIDECYKDNERRNSNSPAGGRDYNGTVIFENSMEMQPVIMKGENEGNAEANARIDYGTATISVFGVLITTRITHVRSRKKGPLRSGMSRVSLSLTTGNVVRSF